MYIMRVFNPLAQKEKAQKVLAFLDLCIGKNATVTHYINGARNRGPWPWFIVMAHVQVP